MSCPLINKFEKKHFSIVITTCIIVSIFTATPFSADNEIEQFRSLLTKIPSIYYSPQAYAFYTGKGITLPEQPSVPKASGIYKDIIKVPAKGLNAKEIIPILINSFNKAIHVTEIKNVHYRGEGTFEDWIYTYVAGEKNKFFLSSPFLDYNAMMLCEGFTSSSHEVTRINGETVTIPTRDPVIITVTHTLYPAAYALSVITGEKLGIDQITWQEWWNANGATFSGPAISDSAASEIPPMYGKLQSGQLFKDIVLHGKYQLFLTTGNILTGRIESKNDTSLIIESTDGKPYLFRPTLISRYEYLEPPSSSLTNGSVTTVDSMPFSFDELRNKTIGNRQIEVRVNNGMVFRGFLKDINEEMMNITTGGSTIPISRDVTISVRFVPVVVPNASKQTSGEALKKSSPETADTIYVKNSTTDDWGVPGPELVYRGTIVFENADTVIIETDSSNDVSLPRKSIVRVVKNSTNSYESTIQRYAKALFCPEDMFIVDIPPGKEGRPFFKVCVDRYEFPNSKGKTPKTNVSYDEARQLCAKKGKRLCTADEWKWACSGLEEYTYPYGWNPDREKCNTSDNRPEESGLRHNCYSKFGGHDMVGNVFEWVIGAKRQPSIMGGPNSKCQTITEGIGGSAKPQSGFRCCKSN